VAGGLSLWQSAVFQGDTMPSGVSLKRLSETGAYFILRPETTYLSGAVPDEVIN